MQRKNMIWVAVEDVHSRVVGSLAKFRHKRRMANDKGYRARHLAEQKKPTTFAKMLDLVATPTLRETYVDSHSICGADGSGQMVFGSLSDALGLSGSGSMRAALGV